MILPLWDNVQLPLSQIIGKADLSHPSYLAVWLYGWTYGPTVMSLSCALFTSVSGSEMCVTGAGKLKGQWCYIIHCVLQDVIWWRNRARESAVAVFCLSQHRLKLVKCNAMQRYSILSLLISIVLDWIVLLTVRFYNTVALLNKHTCGYSEVSLLIS